MEAPDIKTIGLNIAEDMANSVIDQIVAPYAKYYAAEKGGAVGAIIAPFIDDLKNYLKKEVVDLIDGEDDIK